jgi:hypothetical protein
LRVWQQIYLAEAIPLWHRAERICVTAERLYMSSDVNSAGNDCIERAERVKYIVGEDIASTFNQFY